MSYVDHQRVLTSLGGSLKEISFTEHASLSLALNCSVQPDSQCQTDKRLTHFQASLAIGNCHCIEFDEVMYPQVIHH